MNLQRKKKYQVMETQNQQINKKIQENELFTNIPPLRNYFPVKLNINEENELVRQKIQEEEEKGVHII